MTNKTHLTSRARLAALTLGLSAALASPCVASTLDSFTVDIESGPLKFLQNDQRYGAAGTPYTMGTVALDRSLFEAKRVSAEVRAFERHTMILLYAPLDVTTRVSLTEPLTFRDTTFPTGSVVDHRYLFDGWRASYLYRVLQTDRWILEGGATLGVRNAVVSFTQVDGTRFDSERDIGPVPALKLRARYDAEAGHYALFDFDGLTTPGLSTFRGGILDTALTLGVPLWPGLDGTLRLRYVAGGADVPNRPLSNWAQFVVAGAGFRWSMLETKAP